MRLLLAGDVMLGRLVNKALECAMSAQVPASLPDKAFHFRSDKKHVGVPSRQLHR